MNRTKILLFLLSIIAYMPAMSQQIAPAKGWKMVSFEESSTAHDATIDKVYDGNKKLCAVIKINIPGATDVEIVGDYVMKQEKVNGLWRVYIAERGKKIRTIINDVTNDHDFEPVEGGHTYEMELHEIKPYPSPSRKPNPLKPERFTMDVGMIAGSNLGASIDVTASYFLIGFGVDWVLRYPERTKTTNLVNSGYIGNFTKETTSSLSGFCTNIFFNVGGYFKYFSLSCQIGWLFGTVNRTMSYDGSGQGLVDGDISEYWGTYEQRHFENSTINKEGYVTLTPQLKGYIPIGKQKKHSLSLGLGYTFVPKLKYDIGLSGNLGIHYRF